MSYLCGNLGKNTKRANPHPLAFEEFAKLAHDYGFEMIETPLARFFPSLGKKEIEKIKKILKKYNLEIIVDLEKPGTIEQLNELIPIAATLNSPIIRMKSSNILECARCKLNKSWKDHVMDVISILKAVVPQLRNYGVKIAIENHQDLDSYDLKDIIETVDKEYVGVTYDIGNALATCEHPSSFAKRLGSSILNIHIKDYMVYKSNEGHRLVRCAIGKGIIDFPTIFDYLEKVSSHALKAVELGAHESRHITWCELNFWKEMQPRDQKEHAEFIKYIKKSWQKNKSWQTPWEKNANHEKMLKHELQELKESVEYLKKIIK